MNAAEHVGRNRIFGNPLFAHGIGQTTPSRVYVGLFQIGGTFDLKSATESGRRGPRSSVAGLHDVAVVRESVQERRRQLRAHEHTGPRATSWTCILTIPAISPSMGHISPETSRNYAVNAITAAALRESGRWRACAARIEICQRRACDRAIARNSGGPPGRWTASAAIETVSSARGEN